MAVTAVVESRDLLRIIFDFSECNYENALVNRTWCQEALDLLWYEVSNFVVLARLLLAQNPRAHSLSEPNWCPTASAWDTFYKYSSRVRILHDEDWDSYAYSIFPIMAATRPRRDLFPNLQLLHFQLSVASPLPHLPMLLGSSLRDLQIWIPYMEAQEVWDALMGSLTYVPVFSPHLERLSLFVHPGFYKRPYELDFSNCIGIQCLSAVPSLKQLTIPFPESPALLTMVTSLPSLGKLSLHGLGDYSRSMVYNLPPSNFAVLKDLELNCTPLSLALSLLHEDLFSLQSLHINIDAEQYGDLDPLFSCIATNHKDLESLRIGVKSFDQSTTKRSFTFSKMRHLLSSCKLLRKLVIDDLSRQVDLKISTDELIELVEALPLLQVLALDNTIEACAQPPCLSDLARVAVHCPALTHLSLNIDAREFSLPHDSTPIKFPSLRALDVRSSPISGPLGDVVYFLRVILPEECTIKCRPYLSSYSQCWKNVIAVFPSLVQAQQHGTTRMNI